MTIASNAPRYSAGSKTCVLVTTDGVAQRKAIDRVYAQIANATPAHTFVTEFYRADPPFQRAQTETVAVEVKSVLATSDRTYEIEWEETTRDLYGADQIRGALERLLHHRPEPAQGRTHHSHQPAGPVYCQRQLDQGLVRKNK